MARETKLSVEDISKLLELVTDVAEQGACTPSEAVHRISKLLSSEKSGDPPRDRAAMAEFVARVRQLRLRRNELIGAPLFRDLAWDMLLELFVAHESGRKVSVSSLCYASGVPATTALRQLSRLERHGLITREGDPTDNRRHFVSATPKAIAAIARAAAMLVEHSQLAV